MANLLHGDLFNWLFLLSICRICTGVSNNQDSCSVSLIVPKNSIKSSCSDVDRFNHKMRSIEGQFVVLRNVINDIKIQINNKPSSDSQAQDVGELKRQIREMKLDIIQHQEVRIGDLETETIPQVQERLEKLEAARSEERDLLAGSYQGGAGGPRMLVPSRRDLFRLMKPHIKSEINKMKEEIKAEVLKELKDELAISHSRPSVSSETDFRGNSEYETQVTGMNDDQYYKNENRVSENDTNSEFYKQAEQLALSFQKSAQKHSKRSNRRKTKGGVYDNELPEDISSDTVQSDSRVGINRAFEAFRQEIKLTLRHETERVKSLTKSNAQSVEEKLTQILKIIEQLKRHYDGRLSEIEFHHGVTVTNNRLEEIEENIANLEMNISVLKENMFTDPKLLQLLRDEQLSTQNQIYGEMSTITSPLKTEVGFVKEQFETSLRLQRVIETTLQNFKADIRLKMYFAEENITTLAKQIDLLNSTVNVDYGDINFDMEKAKEELRVMNAVHFIDGIRDKWPYIETNFSQMEEKYANDTVISNNKIKNLQNELVKLKVNQSDFRVRLAAIDKKVTIINETVTKLDNTQLETALNNMEWIEYNFKHTFTRSACYGGKQYVKKTRYKVGQFVGAVLCSQSKYKLYLSDSLTDTFLDIGDARQFGEDHCEFVGGRRQRKVKIDKNTHQFSRIAGYKRGDWGQTPIKGTLNFFSPSPTWYECGVNIPE